MSDAAFLAPVFVQVAVTFALMFRMAAARTRALREGQVKFGDIALGEPAWPPAVTQIGRAFHNQLELPILFYAAVAFAMIARKTDALLLGLAWLYVLLRLAHLFIHVTSNNVPRRFLVFAASSGALMALWIAFAARLVFGG